MNQRGATEQVDPFESTERAAGMLESALAAGDLNGIDEAVSLFDEVMSVCSQVRIPIESDHLFRSNPIADSGVPDRLAGVGVS